MNPFAVAAFTAPDAAALDQAQPDRQTINRQNAQHSTGPRTEEGKTKVRLNAIKHGATSKQALLPNENPAAFDALSEYLLTVFDVRSEQERHLLHSVRDLTWKIQRLRRYEESVMLTIHVQALAKVNDQFSTPEDEPLDDRTRHSLAEGASYLAHRGTLNQLHRHSRNLQRDLNDKEAILRAIILARRPAPADAPRVSDQVPLGSDKGAAMLEFQRTRDARDGAIRDAEAEMIAEVEAALKANRLHTDPEDKEPCLDQVESIETADNAGTSEEAAGFVLYDALPNPAQPETNHVKMPKFAGPNRKQARKNWLRAQRKAVAQAA